MNQIALASKESLFADPPWAQKFSAQVAMVHAKPVALVERLLQQHLEHPMKPVFKNDEAKARMLDWFERFRARLTVPTERPNVPTHYGESHVLVAGPAVAPRLVVLHGAMASSAHTLGELGPLLAKLRVYSLDVIGQSVEDAARAGIARRARVRRWLGRGPRRRSGSRASQVVARELGRFVASPAGGACARTHRAARAAGARRDRRGLGLAGTHEDGRGR